MKYEKFAALVTEESTDCVYLSDPVTYELLYLNKACAQLLGAPDWEGKPCYQVIQGLSSPCPFCNNSYLASDRFLHWEHYNASIQRHFSIRDKLVTWQGRKVRLEIAHDITEMVKNNHLLRHRLQTENTLMNCVKALSTGEDLAASVHRLLELVGGYYGADRAYIFEFEEKSQTFSNTYEWCSRGVSPRRGALQDLPGSILDLWMEKFQRAGEFYLPDLALLPRDSPAFAILSAQGVHSLMAAPLMELEKVTGFVGVNNPRENVDDMALLRSLPFFIVDTFQKRHLIDRLRFLSYTDGLTGVWNRRKYQEDLLALEGRPPESLGILYLDINGLKRINDSRGHRVGDQVIQHTAEVLTQVCRGEIYRVGGDEFIVLAVNVDKFTFEHMILELYSLIDQDPDFNPSIGSSWSEDPSSGIHQQLSRSDQVMRANKQSYYTGHIQPQDNFRAQLSQSLLQELRDNRFLVQIQPQLNLETGAIWGGEALIRRLDKCDKMIPPIRFIPFFETVGIIRHVDFYVLETVCATLRRWREQGYLCLPIAVNFSRVTMMEHGIVESLTAVCRKYDVSPSSIRVEVTESIGSMDAQTLKRLILDLKKSGFSISLDDFGAHYSNLALLTDGDFDEIKLDKSLVDGLEHNQNACLVAAHTIEMSKQLGIGTSVGEGIESASQRDILKSLHCDVGQGYFFDRPMSILDFEGKYLVASSAHG